VTPSSCESIDDRVCSYKFLWCGFEAKISNLVTPKYLGLLYTGQYRQSVKRPLEISNIASNERESRNSSRMSRSKNLVCRSTTREQTSYSVEFAFISPNLRNQTTNLMPKLNICNRLHAMYGSCMDDDIHSQLLSENNSKSITCMSEIVSKYLIENWPKSQQLSESLTDIILANLASLSS
jgi:hypothetical protein